MASKSRTESSRAQPRRALAPKMLLLALVGVLAWGVWRVLGPGEGAASKPVPGVLTQPPAVSREQTPALAPALVLTQAIPTTATSAAPASLQPAVAPATVLAPPSVASNGVVPLVGITSAPVTLSTQILRVSGPSLSLSSSNTPSAWESRGATNYLEAQIALAGLGFSSGSIDGVGGAQTAAALKAFQRQQGLEQTGWLDRNTRKVLILRRPPVGSYRVSADDLLRLAPVPETWVGKSQVLGLEHETLLERLAERFQTHPGLLRRLNPAVDWAQPTEGLELTFPAIPPIPARRAGLIRINLAGRFLRVFDTSGELMAHFPCSIARRVEKRPVGDLQVSVTVPNPDYTWDPEVFPESPESRTVGRKLRIPPGPNNPVGVAWIGLNRSGYGIHGTPKPEDVGRTESHGCFRLANWNAELLRRMAWPGLTVRVEGEVPGTPSTALTASATTVTNAVKASLPSGVSTNTAAPASSSVPAITNSVSTPPL